VKSIIYVSPSADPVKTSDKQGILKKKKGHKKSAQKDEHIANICHGQEHHVTISDKAKKITDCAKSETSTPLWL